MSSTRDDNVARDIVEQFSLHKVVLMEPPTYRQYSFDHNELEQAIKTALRAHEQAVRPTERATCVEELQSVLHGARFHAADFMGRDRRSNEIVEGIQQCIDTIRRADIDAEREG